MSTKSSIAYGEKFHLYRDLLFPDDIVCLELENVEFEAYLGRVMVTIPLAVWSYIREYDLADFSLIDISDEEIRTTVEEEVDKRIAQYRKKTSRANTIASSFGLLRFGDVESPRQQQIEQGIKSLTEDREYQRQLKRQIEDLRQFDHPKSDVGTPNEESTEL